MNFRDSGARKNQFSTLIDKNEQHAKTGSNLDQVNPQEKSLPAGLSAKTKVKAEALVKAGMFHTRLTSFFSRQACSPLAAIVVPTCAVMIFSINLKAGWDNEYRELALHTTYLDASALSPIFSFLIFQK